MGAAPFRLIGAEPETTINCRLPERDAKLKVTQVVTSIEEEASGPSYTVPRLGQSIAELGHHVTLLSLGEANERVERRGAEGTYRDIRLVPDITWPRTLARLGVSRGMRRALLRSDADVMHTHGLWMMPNVYPAFAARAHRRPLVLSPRGMLGAEALKFSYSVKRAFWAVFQGAAARHVACFHATADEEYRDIRAFGLAQPVAVVPNGIDLPVEVGCRETGALRGAAPPFVLSLGRIHPKKGLDRLIAAWSRIEPDFPNWSLRIVGPDEGGYSDQLRRLVGEMGLKKVSVEGPVYGDRKIELLSEAALFALSTLNENFAMTVAESLACGTPVISTKGAPWMGLQTNRCGWWIDHGPEAMTSALRSAMTLSLEERLVMGARGRAWMEREFGWDGIARQMTDVYRWLIEGGERPGCVRPD